MSPLNEQAIRYFVQASPITRVYHEIDHAYAMAGNYPLEAEAFLEQAELYAKLAREREQVYFDWLEGTD